VVAGIPSIEEKSCDESGNVGRVAGHKEDGEAAPNVDEELVRPRFGRLEGDQMAAQQTPHHL